MNIFVLDNDTRACAQAHCDAHVVKMMLESAQMLSTTCRLYGLDCGYKITHKNHPCTKWVRESIENFMWLTALALELNEEWKFRFDHTHDSKSIEVIKDLTVPDLPDIPQTPFALAMPDQYKSDDPVQSYRDYYSNEKYEIAWWTYRRPPKWM